MDNMHLIKRRKTDENNSTWREMHRAMEEYLIRKEKMLRLLYVRYAFGYVYKRVYTCLETLCFADIPNSGIVKHIMDEHITVPRQAIQLGEISSVSVDLRQVGENKSVIMNLLYIWTRSSRHTNDMVSDTTVVPLILMAAKVNTTYGKFDSDEQDESTKEQKDEATDEQKDAPTSEQEDAPTSEQENEPTDEQKDESTDEQKDEATDEQKDEATDEQEHVPTSEQEDAPTSEQENAPTSEQENEPTDDLQLMRPSDVLILWIAGHVRKMSSVIKLQSKYEKYMFEGQIHSIVANHYNPHSVLCRGNCLIVPAKNLKEITNNWELPLKIEVEINLYD